MATVNVNGIDLYYVEAGSGEPLILFAPIMLAKALGFSQVSSTRFLRFVLAYGDGRNSLDTLTPEFRANLDADTPAFLAELSAGTGDELDLDTLKAQIKVPVKFL